MTASPPDTRSPPHPALLFLQKLRDSGTIVSSGRCSAEEIAIAQACDRFFVDDEHFGYIYRPPMAKGNWR